MNGESNGTTELSLSDSISAEIAEIQSRPRTQATEVAVSFLCRARVLAQEGKEKLALRQRVAARNVLAGGTLDLEGGVEGENGAR